LTIREIAMLTSQDVQQFELHKGNFLDAFYRSTPEQQQAMVAEEPEKDDRLPPRILPFLAGMVEKLCNDYHLPCPKWVFAAAYYLDKPSFWMDAKGDFRVVLLVESPVEFKMRNIFTTSNTLVRV
jgi:hypothetical protein